MAHFLRINCLLRMLLLELKIIQVRNMCQAYNKKPGSPNLKKTNQARDSIQMHLHFNYVFKHTDMFPCKKEKPCKRLDNENSNTFREIEREMSVFQRAFDNDVHS